MQTLLRSVVAALAGAALLAGGCSQHESPTGYAVGQCMPIGGGMKDDNAELFKWMTSRHQFNRVVVVPYATASPEGADKRMAERLEKHGWHGKVDQLPDALKGETERQAAVKMLAGADLIFFTGGVQTRIVERFQAAPELKKALNDAIHKEGTLVAGTSAGAAMMSDPMLTGGGSESALAGTPADDGERDEPGSPESKQPVKSGVQIGPGMGLVTPITDQHFFERGRVGRLVAALEKIGVPYGVGIGENRGVAISDGTDCVALGGDCAALLVDVRELKRQGLSRLGTRVSLMSPGDTWSYPRNGERDRGVQSKRPLSSGAVGITPPALNPAETPKAWGKLVVLDMLKRLAADPRTVQVARSERFELVITADDRTRFGWSAENPGALTVINAKLDIVELTTAAPSPKP